MANGDTQRIGTELFIDEVERRGGAVVKAPGSGQEALYDVTGIDGQSHRIKLKTKKTVRSGTWRGSKRAGEATADPGLDAWVFVANDGDVAQSAVVPAEHMRRDVAERVAQWLADDPSRSVEKDDHLAIGSEHVQGWTGRWDIIGLGEEAPSAAEPEEEPDVEQILTVGPAGAGFGDPESNRLVEAAAVEQVTDYLEARGYVVTDVGSKKLGWDLTCVGDAGDIRRVEVKGVSGATPTVLLTANEHRSAQEDNGWELAVVTAALDSPCLTFYTAADATAVAAPMVYRLTLPGVQER
ncbi:DUF3883 domain-containing protein [Gordonia iterans]